MYMIAEKPVLRFITSLLLMVSLVLLPVISAQASMNAEMMVVAQEAGQADGLPCHSKMPAKSSTVVQYKIFDHNPCKQCCKDKSCQNCLLCNACMTATHFSVLLINVPPVLFNKAHPAYLLSRADKYINITLSPDLQPPIA